MDNATQERQNEARPRKPLGNGPMDRQHGRLSTCGREGEVAVDTVFEGKRKRSPTTRTRAVLIAGLMMLEREAALKPAR
jgi:hypothetical protein